MTACKDSDITFGLLVMYFETSTSISATCAAVKLEAAVTADGGCVFVVVSAKAIGVRLMLAADKSVRYIFVIILSSLFIDEKTIVNPQKIYKRGIIKKILFF